MKFLKGARPLHYGLVRQTYGAGWFTFSDWYRNAHNPDAELFRSNMQNTVHKGRVPKKWKTRSSWLNCASRDNEAVFWVSIGHYEAVGGGGGGDLDRCYRCLTD